MKSKISSFVLLESLKILLLPPWENSFNKNKFLSGTFTPVSTIVPSDTDLKLYSNYSLFKKPFDLLKLDAKRCLSVLAEESRIWLMHLDSKNCQMLK